MYERGCIHIAEKMPRFLRPMKIGPMSIAKEAFFRKGLLCTLFLFVDKTMEPYRCSIDWLVGEKFGSIYQYINEPSFSHPNDVITGTIQNYFFEKPLTLNIENNGSIGRKSKTVVSWTRVDARMMSSRLTKRNGKTSYFFFATWHFSLL